LLKYTSNDILVINRTNIIHMRAMTKFNIKNYLNRHRIKLR